FEGKGTFNPPRYHHRYNQIPTHERGAVPGTIPNGFVRELGMADRPGMDLSRGGSRAPSYRTNEPCWSTIYSTFWRRASSIGQWPHHSLRVTSNLRMSKS